MALDIPVVPANPGRCDCRGAVCQPGASGFIQLGCPGGSRAAHETFDYSVEWRLINAGKAHLEWDAAPSGPASISPTAGDVKLHVESAGLVSRVFLVNDEYTAAMKSGFCAESTLIQAQEGGRHKETRVTYDDVAHKAFYVEKDLIKNTTATQDVAIPNCVHDLIGGLIVLRFLHWDSGPDSKDFPSATARNLSWQKWSHSAVNL